MVQLPGAAMALGRRGQHRPGRGRRDGGADDRCCPIRMGLRIPMITESLRCAQFRFRPALSPPEVRELRRSRAWREQISRMW